MCASCSSLFLWLAHKCLDCGSSLPNIKCKSSCCNSETHQTLEKQVDALQARLWALSVKRRAQSGP